MQNMWMTKDREIHERGIEGKTGGTGGLKFISRDGLYEKTDQDDLWVDPGDPQENFWEYSQSGRKLTRVDGVTGKRTLVDDKGYSGVGGGLNNPDMQYVKDVGPIPQGKWQIGEPRNGGSKGPYVMDLTPDEETDTKGRCDFLIHGDNSKGDFSASEGCIVLGRGIREQIGKSGIDELRVIP